MEWLPAHPASGRQGAVRRDVRRAAAEILKVVRRRGAVHLWDGADPLLVACPAERRGALVPVEMVAREVVVPLAERLVLHRSAEPLPVVVHSEQLPQEQPELQPQAVLRRARPLERELRPEQPDEQALPVLAARLPEQPQVAPAKQPLAPQAALLLDVLECLAQALPLQEQPELPPASREVQPVSVQQAASLVSAQLQARRERQALPEAQPPVLPDAQALPWPPSSRLPQQLLAQPIRGNASARVRRARGRASSSASSFPQRRSRARSRSGPWP